MKTRNFINNVTIEAERDIVFGIEFGPFMVDLLSNKLYSDPLSAVIRELSTNGMDSHIEAGKPNLPINVILPNPSIPNLVIEDFGIGLSQEQIETIVPMYGKSTKRDTNDLQGCMGLGMKTPFAYNTKSYKLESVYNGMLHVYTASIGSDGKPHLVHMMSAATDKCNGLRLTIPVSRYDCQIIADKAAKIYKYFDVHPNVIGKYTKVEKEEPLLSSDWWNIYPNRRTYGYVKDNNAIAIMGNIGYPIRFNHLSIKDGFLNSSGQYSCGFDIKVPIGKLDLTPSREELQYTTKTKNVLTALLNKMRDEAISLASDKITSATNLWEASCLALEFTKQLGLPHLQWNGQNTVKIIPTKGFAAYKFLGNARKRDITEIHVNKNVKFYYRDIKKGVYSRCQSVSSYDTPIVLFDDDILDLDKVKERLLGAEILPVSSIPKPEIVRNFVSGVGKVNRANWPRGRFRRKSDYWDEVSVDFSDSKERVYVQMSNLDVVFRDKITDMHAVKHQMETVTSNLELYGVRKSLLKQLPDNWIKLEDYIDREAKKLFDNSQSLIKEAQKQNTAKSIRIQLNSIIGQYCTNLLIKSGNKNIPFVKLYLDNDIISHDLEKFKVLYYDSFSKELDKNDPDIVKQAIKLARPFSILKYIDKKYNTSDEEVLPLIIKLITGESK